MSGETLQHEIRLRIFQFKKVQTKLLPSIASISKSFFCMNLTEKLYKKANVQFLMI